MSPRELRQFGLTLAIPLGILAAVGAWRGHALVPAVLGGLAAASAGFALLAPGLLGPVHKRWMEMAHALGWFNTRLLLSLVYFVVMTPTGALMRLLGRDPLNRRLGDRPSYWVQRQQHLDPRRSMELHF
ncbi:MAG: SxtJ family membrane protein [bacterium]